MISRKMMSAAADREFENYRTLHPRTPSAIRQPRLSFRSGVWVALLGDSVKDGIAGFGRTVELALAAFDCQYLNTLRQPGERIVSRASYDSNPRSSARISSARAA
jgi:hypothetical protein